MHYIFFQTEWEVATSYRNANDLCQSIAFVTLKIYPALASSTACLVVQISERVCLLLFQDTH